MSTRDVFARSALVALLGPLLAPPATPQQLLSGIGGSAGEHLGRAMVPFRDWDGDGHVDYLIGIPGSGNAVGTMRLLSGAWLSNGQGTQWLHYSSGFAQPGDLYGTSIAVIGDFDADGVDDVAVGSPGYDEAGVIDAGAAILLSGATLNGVYYYSLPATGAHTGQNVAAIPDLTGDGVAELAIAVAGTYPLTGGEVEIFSGRPDASGTWQQIGRSLGAAGHGSALVPWDFDGDGRYELVVGSPNDAVSGVGAEAGNVLVVQPDAYDQAVAWFSGQTPGAHFGASVALCEDYDGDGVRELLVGSPDWIGPSGVEEGRVQLLSGATVLTSVPDVVLREHRGSDTPGGAVPSWHLGTQVCATADLNGDGFGDYLLGMPDYEQGGFIGQGAVEVRSGSTGLLVTLLIGDHIGDALGDVLPGAVEDYDGDGFPELVVAGSSSDLNGPDSGLINTYRLFPVAPQPYCVGKPNSLGCVPAVTWSGAPSASSALPFTAACTNLLNNKQGVMFYGFAPEAKPFQGGTKCVASPVKRLPQQGSGGSPTGNDCTGTYAYELNGLIQSGVNPALVAGAQVYCQFWSRDPISSFGSSLSDGLQFVINP